MPALAEDFAKEQQALRRDDIMHNGELYRKAMASGHERPDVKTQATLNLWGEREALDSMEHSCKSAPVPTGHALK